LPLDPIGHLGRPADRIAKAAAARAADLRAAGAWSIADEAELDRRFEVAAVAALRAPALAERSARLRRIGRRAVPQSLRPAARLAVRGIDRCAALVLERYEAGRKDRS